MDSKQLNYIQLFSETIHGDHLKSEIERMIYELCRKYGTNDLIDSNSIAEIIVSPHSFFPGNFELRMSIRPKRVDLSDEAKHLIRRVRQIGSSYSAEHTDSLFRLLNQLIDLEEHNKLIPLQLTNNVCRFNC